MLSEVVGVLGCLAFASVQPTRDAQPADALRLQWDAPATCPSEDEVRRRVELSIPPGETASHRVDAQATVTSTSTADWQLALVINTGQGTLAPVASARDCETLTDAAVVHLVMALEPRMPPAPAPSPSDPSPAQPRPTDPPPPTVATTTAPATPRDPNRLRAVLGAGGGIGFGLLPTYDATIMLSVALVRRLRSRIEAHARAELWVGHVFAQSEPLVGDANSGVGVSAWWLGPRGCWEPVVRGRAQIAVFSFPLCGGLDFAAVTGRGEGVESPGRATRLWLAAAAGASGQWQPLRRLGVRVGAETFVTLLQPSFTIDAGAPVYTVRRAGVRGFVALAVTLP